MVSNGVTDLERKRLAKLPPQELSRHLMRLPARQRLEAILQRPDADQVVAALAEQDLYLCVKEIGPEDALILLGLARVGQLHHLFDLEWWQKDAVQPIKAVEWLDRLARASEVKLLEWLYTVDFELLLTLFKRWIRVAVTAEDMDPLEARDQLPRNTLDDMYFWETRYPQYEEFFTQLLGLIYEENAAFYRELMNHLLWVIDVEIEQEAYRFHSSRLQDQMIPEFHEALEIYRPLTAGQMAPAKQTLGYGAAGLPAPSFALALIPEADLLGRALREIRDPALFGTLQQELAALANKVVVADQLPPDSSDALHQAVDKVAAYVNLGLQLGGGADPATAIPLLGNVFLEHLFRLGHTRVMSLRNRLRQICQKGWLSQWPKQIHILDADWLNAAEWLLHKTPRLLRFSSAAKGAPVPDLFRSRKDLQQGGHVIDVIVALEALFEALAVHPERLAMGLWQAGQIRELEDVTLGALLWTAAAQLHWQGRWQVQPLQVRGWANLFPSLQPSAMEETVRSWVEGVVASAGQRELLESYLNPLFREYAEEMAPFAREQPPDPHLVKSFLFAAS